MQFFYCPQCGRELDSRPFGDDGTTPWCSHCHKPYFAIFPVVAITMVVNELGEVAALKQGYLSGDYYNFVSGYVRPGETAEDCALREVREEIGVTAHGLRFVCSQWADDQQMLLLGFAAQAEKTDFTLSGEVDEALWLPAEEALAKVYPAGNITNTLLVQYLKAHKRGEGASCKL